LQFIYDSFPEMTNPPSVAWASRPCIPIKKCMAETAMLRGAIQIKPNSPRWFVLHTRTAERLPRPIIQIRRVHYRRGRIRIQRSGALPNLLPRVGRILRMIELLDIHPSPGPVGVHHVDPLLVPPQN